MTQKTQQPSGYRPDIDGLRAIAVIAVVAFHAFPVLAPGGFVGVDVFFVISGYLISRIIFSGLQDKNFSFRRFYAHRIKRIFPALMVLLLGCMALGWFVMLPDEYMQLGKHIAASALFVQNINLWREVGYFDVTAELKPLLHLWSLSVEEQFYLVYPFILWAAWKIRLHLLALILLLGAVSLAMNIERPGEAFFLLHTRFWELLVGGALAYQHWYKPELFFNAMTVRKKNIFLNAFNTAGLLLVILVVVSTSHTNSNQLLTEWMTAVVGTCFLISVGPDTWINKNLLANRPLVFIGLISYPLYLWHWSLLSFLRLIQHDPSSIQKLIAVALSFVLAWMTYQWIELPFRYGKNSSLKTTALVGLLTLTGCLGLMVFKYQGLPFRFQGVEDIAAYHYDYSAYAKQNRCWVDTEMPLSAFSPQCIGALASPLSTHTVLVWGDSHAAHIYPEIDRLLGGHESVAEFARNACAPIIDSSTSNCARSNQYVLVLIKKNVPETVVLFAFWGSYSKQWNAEAPLASQLLDTLHQLRAAGVKNILLMGPAPQWSATLPDIILKLTMADRPLYRIPQRLHDHLEPTSAVIDAELKALVSQESGVQYFSTWHALCNVDGCLVRASDDPTSFTAYDYGHLTMDGAQYVAKQLPLAVNQASNRP